MKKEKRKRAVALKYDSSFSSPQVVAKGIGKVAENILENGKEVPVYKDEALVDELTKIDLGENIPPELYEIVAQVLVFVSDLDKREQMKKNAIK